MPRGTRSSTSKFIRVLQIVIFLLGSMYTVTQFGSTVLQEYPPRLSYETRSTSTWGAVIAPTGILPQTVSFTFIIRNDGIQDSGRIFASVVVSGGISGQFTVDYHDGFDPQSSTSESYDYDYFALTGATTPIMPPGTTFGYSTGNQFYVNVGNIAGMSYISLVFSSVSVPVFSPIYPNIATANVTAVSEYDYPIVSSTQSFQTQSYVMQTLFVAYLSIVVLAVWLAITDSDLLKGII